VREMTAEDEEHTHRAGTQEISKKAQKEKE
jgi:hypothetical protein